MKRTPIFEAAGFQKIGMGTDISGSKMKSRTDWRISLCCFRQGRGAVRKRRQCFDPDIGRRHWLTLSENPYRLHSVSEIFLYKIMIESRCQEKLQDVVNSSTRNTIYCILCHGPGDVHFLRKSWCGPLKILGPWHSRKWVDRYG
jgi:hypothetical protein